jgi:hypothetical protein
MIASLRRRVRKQRDVPRSLDGPGQVALLLRIQPADPTRNDLAAIRNEMPELLRVFVIKAKVWRQLQAGGTPTPTPAATSIIVEASGQAFCV